MQYEIGGGVSLVASGKVHARGTSRTLTVAVTFVGSVLFVAQFPDIVPLITGNWPTIGAVVSGLVVGHYAPPDVRDQQKLRNHGEKMVEDDFGKLAGWLWSAAWEPLARMIPHRHWASHLPGVATGMAAAWLWWLPLAVMWWYGYTVPIDVMCWHVAGWAVQDMVHLMQDRWKVRW